MWIGGGVNESPAIWAFSGNTAEKVSTTAIDSILQKMPTEEIQGAFAYSFAQSGAYFAGFTFDTITLEFNTVTNKWNTRTSLVTDARGEVSIQRWRANSVVTAYNRVLCGDAIDGRIGDMRRDIYTEYGGEILRVFSTQPFANQGTSFFVPNLELTMESGVGLEGVTVEPQIRLSYSKDAKTFNNEIWRGFGKIGEYFRRAIWRRLGRFSRFAVFRFEMSEPVKPVIIKLEADIVSGN